MREENTRTNSIYIDSVNKSYMEGLSNDKSIFPETNPLGIASLFNYETSLMGNPEVSCDFLANSLSRVQLFEEVKSPYTLELGEPISISTGVYNPSVLGSPEKPWEARISSNNHDHIFGTAIAPLTVEIDDPISISHKLYSEPSTLVNIASCENLAGSASRVQLFEEVKSPYTLELGEPLSISTGVYNPSVLGSPEKPWEARISSNNHDHIFGKAIAPLTVEIDDPISISHRLYSEPSTLVNITSCENLASSASHVELFEEVDDPFTIELNKPITISSKLYHEITNSALSHSTAINSVNSSSYLTGLIEDEGLKNIGSLFSSNHYESNGLITSPLTFNTDAALTLSGFERKLTRVLDKIENYERIKHFGWEFESKGEVNIINIFITIQGDINGSHAHIGNKYLTQNVND